MKQLCFRTVHILKKLYADHPTILPILIFGPFTTALIPFYTYYFSAAILNALLGGSTSQALEQVLFLIGGNTILRVISRLCANQEHILEWDVLDYSMSGHLRDKCFSIEYAKYESEEVLSALRKAEINQHMGYNYGNILEQTIGIMTQLWTLLISLIMMCVLFLASSSWPLWLSLVTLCGVLFSVLCASGLVSWLGARINQKLDFYLKQNFELNSSGNYFIRLRDQVSNGKDIRIYHMQDLLIDRLKHYFQFNGREQCRLEGLFSGVNGGSIQALGMLAYFVIGLKVLEGDILVGDVLFYANGILSFSAASATIIKCAHFLHMALQGVDETLSFIESEDMSYDGTLPVEKRDDGQYHFSLQDVSFRYPGSSNWVLHHINLNLTVGKSYALVGLNGSGKTTLVKLLCRLYEPTEGKILLNGIDITKYDYDEYVSLFSVVFQDFQLLSLPLDENVACSMDVDAAKFTSVMEQVNLQERLPDPHVLLFKECGDGINLSGGEAQKVAIARALYKDAPFVILDEPTSALDPISEAEIYENFSSLIENKTAIYISHRMSSCRFCEEIVVLDHGNIVERGNHESLLAQKGLYANLYETQAQYYAEAKQRDEHQ